MKPSDYINKIKTLLKEDIKHIRHASAAAYLTVYFLLVIMVPNLMLCFTEPFTFLDRVVNIVLPAGFYILIISLAKRVGMTVLLMLPFVILAGWQIVLLYLYGESIIAVDMYLNFVTTNPSEATELLANLGPAIVLVVVLYVPLIPWSIILLCKHKKLKEEMRKRLRRIGIYGFGLGIILMGLNYLVDRTYRVERDTYPVNVIYNIKVAVDRTIEVSHYLETSANFKYEAVATHPVDSAEVYVLVIGETSRAINWELGEYPRPTNPKLKQREGVVFFPNAISESNTTHKSVPMLMTSLSAINFTELSRHKSILEAFNEAGYSTSFISNQAPNHSYTEYFGEQADKTIYIESESDNHAYDGEMIPYLEKFLSDTTNTRHFAVLHGYGSHFKYSERYTDDCRVFTPDNCKTASVGNRSTLINAYDNSIVYTDAWLDELFEMLEKIGRPAAVIFVSDHGEDIMDDERHRFLHASPTPTYYQLHVAMLAWTSKAYREKYPEKAKNMENNGEKSVNSSVTTFNTIIDLAGIKTPYLTSRYSIASENYTPAQINYLTDQNEAVKIEDCGLKSIDLNLISPHIPKGN